MRKAAERTLTVGAFARRARLSPKALRLYDRLGVLSLAAVDEHNGYRESQPAAAPLIVALRRLDMPLAPGRLGARQPNRLPAPSVASRY
ncbi:MAG TPA: MerR family DNA-binding transcriptional regulator [Propionibacteriaceae bacterium]|nr:MerR family DNA-binding transcriptional regulator [Propionibacteriaceae bacterium]